MKNFTDLLVYDDVEIRNKILDLILNIERYSVDFLSKLVTHSDKNVRKIALDGLYRSDLKNALPAIRICLDDKDINMKITAIEYLGKKKDYSAKDDIVKIILTQDNLMLQSACIEALCEIGDATILDLLDPKFVENNPNNNLLLFSYIKLVSKFGGVKSFDFILQKMDFLADTNIIQLTEVINSIMQRTNLKKLPDKIAVKLLEILKYKAEFDTDKVKLLFLIARYNFDDVVNDLYDLFVASNEFIQSAILDCVNTYGTEKALEILEKIKNSFKIENVEILNMLDDTIETLKKKMKL